MKVSSEFLFVIFFVSLTQHSFAQNLIPNGDFESFSICPNNTGQHDRLDDWFSPANYSTPDYLHTCATPFSGVEVPNNFHTYQQPLSGDAFIGMLLYRSQSMVREYISVQLTEPLEEGLCYKFEMYVNLADQSPYAINRIGVHFTDMMIYDESTSPLPFTPLIENPLENILSDTMNWVPLSGEFVADGTEEYLIIGNFYEDSLTNIVTVNTATSQNYAYYYFDNVSVTKCVNTSQQSLFSQRDITVSPNPASDQLNIQIQNQEHIVPFQVRMFDLMGQLVLTSESRGKDSFSINIETLPQGTYFLEITFSGQKYVHKVVRIAP